MNENPENATGKSGRSDFPFMIDEDPDRAPGPRPPVQTFRSLSTEIRRTRQIGRRFRTFRSSGRRLEGRGEPFLHAGRLVLRRLRSASPYRPFSPQPSILASDGCGLWLPCGAVRRKRLSRPPRVWGFGSGPGVSVRIRDLDSDPGPGFRFGLSAPIPWIALRGRYRVGWDGFLSSGGSLPPASAGEPVAKTLHGEGDESWL